MARWLSLCLFIFLVLIPVNAAAHKPSDSYLNLSVAGDRIDGQWDIALRDLEFAVGVDGDGDGAISWAELQARHTAIAAYTLARLSISAGAAACTVTPGEQLVDNHSDGTYAVLRFAAVCPASGDTLDIGYGLFFDLDPQHRGLLQLTSGGQTRTAIFAPSSGRQRFALDRPDVLAQGYDFLVNGIWHIWIGFDHVLFLLTLLLPAMFLRRGGRWEANESIRAASGQVLKIVTAFTLAHSITLSLAALGTIDLPTRLVESVIAASVVIAALNNIYPLVTRRLWIVAFAFGLVHGFGFASVLADLGLPQGALVLALLGFNIGVEIGQLAIVAAFLPLAYLLRAWQFYPRGGLQLGSALVVAVASVWLLERALNVALPVL
ncbi:MAG: HupE/UreJ family protein [Alphaproteobacteria bacterium]|nr:HupE/UreJ family protein [Alphaproteobacteria bacterium]